MKLPLFSIQYKLWYQTPSHAAPSCCLVSLLCITLFCFRFGGKQIEAFEDTGLVNYALVRDVVEEEARLEQYGRELEAE